MDNTFMKSNVNLISNLLHSNTQAHILHFKTKNYSQHKALQAYYEGIVPLLDTYTEGFQGKYGIISGYSNYKFFEDTRTEAMIEYFNKLLSVISKTVVKDSYLANILDTISELIRKTMYMLTNLR